MKIQFDRIPRTIMEKFSGHCIAESINSYHSDVVIRDMILQQHNCIRVIENGDLYYQFDRDADYTWFLLVWA